MPTEPSTEYVVSHAMSCLPATLERLKSYLSTPAISCEREHDADVRRLAARVKDDLVDLGMDQVEVLELPGALPLVAAQWMHAGPEKPTVLIYGHLDLQPVAGEAWTTEPHVATIRGDRLYARGAADDMGGWVSHMAAIEAWLSVAGGLPVNVKLIIEGEEEIGSPHLEQYMTSFPERFEADVMVLTDCENPSVDLPGLTVSLRGLFEVELTCAALEADVHSGLWGNVVPDPGNSLIILLSRLMDEHGRFKLGRQHVDEGWVEQSKGIPLDDQTVRTATRMLDGVAPLPSEGKTRPDWLWRQPAMTIVSTTLPQPSAQKNAVRGQASATLSIRVAPGQTRGEIQELLRETLLRDPPGGVRVSLTTKEAAAESWLYEPEGPAFDAVDRAYEQVWGVRPPRIGIGGSIPFVALFGARFGNLPLILNGVLDPESSAHGPDESLHLGVFEKAVHTNVLLLAELANLRSGA